MNPSGSAGIVNAGAIDGLFGSDEGSGRALGARPWSGPNEKLPWACAEDRTQRRTPAIAAKRAAISHGVDARFLIEQYSRLLATICAAVP